MLSSIIKFLIISFKRNLFFFQSTSPSHSVTANVQHVLHLMKHHSKALCNRRVVNDTAAKPTSSGHPACKNRRPSPTMDSSSSQEELSEVLLTLQDEFGQMSL